MRLASLALLLALTVPACAQTAAPTPLVSRAGRYGMERYLNIRSASRPSRSRRTPAAPAPRRGVTRS